MEFHLAEEGIVVIGIKGGIADERAVMKTGMRVKEVVHDRFQRDGIICDTNPMENSFFRIKNQRKLTR